MDRRRSLGLIGSLGLLPVVGGCSTAGLMAGDADFRALSAPLGPATPQRETLGSGALTVGLLIAPAASLSSAPINSVHLAARLVSTSASLAAIQLEIQQIEASDAAARRATADHLGRGARLLIAAGDVNVARTVASTASPSGVPVISSSYGGDVASNLFQAGFDARDEARAVGAEARRRGVGRALVLSTLDLPASAMLNEAIVAALSGAGIETLPASVTSAGSLTEALLQSGPPDAVVFATGPDVANALVAAAGDAALADVMLVGNSGWNLSHASYPLLSRSWFASPSPTGLRRFADRFAAAYGTNASLEAALIYDLVIMAAALPGVAPQDPYRADVLANPHGFQGFTGNFRFSGEGVVQQRSYAISTLA